MEAATPMTGSDATSPGEVKPVNEKKLESDGQENEKVKEEEESDDDECFFNPDMFTSNIGLEKATFTYGDINTELQFVHDSNQLIEKFVSRVVWPSAQEMCRYFVKHPQLVEGKRILELGSGTGLCGITLAYLGAKQVVLTDYNEAAVNLIRDNVEMNGQSGVCDCFELTWGDPEGAAQVIDASGGEAFDIVLGTDVVYEPECIRPLLQSALMFMEPTNGEFYLANHTHRYAGLEDEVKQTASSLKLRETVLPSVVGDEGQIDMSIFAPPPLES
mmetsp:Transcript_7866/g.14472  ORF Transcript_7866/g.14472 Transcript_7866/m.14472 type:complete len:274 (-) Transcript_7866:194-1015(-)